MELQNAFVETHQLEGLVSDVRPGVTVPELEDFSVVQHGAAGVHGDPTDVHEGLYSRL